MKSILEVKLLGQSIQNFKAVRLASLTNLYSSGNAPSQQGRCTLAITLFSNAC